MNKKKGINLNLIFKGKTKETHSQLRVEFEIKNKRTKINK